MSNKLSQLFLLYNAMHKCGSSCWLVSFRLSVHQFVTLTQYMKMGKGYHQTFFSAWLSHHSSFFQPI